MIWKEITVYTTSEASDLVADIFFSEGGNGVCIYDKKDILDLFKSGTVWDYVDDSVLDDGLNIVLVKGFVPVDCFTQKLKIIEKGLQDLKEFSPLLNCGSLEITVKDIDDEDWINTWKLHFKPIYIKDIVICPKWIDLTNKDKTIVYLDPGMAFGTGEHETTSMCIELMQDFNIKDKAIIDIGCGSGILGVCALKFGGKSAYMTDIDPLAISAAKNCAVLNNVFNKTVISDKLNEDVKGDIIFMNIVADVLIYFSKDIKKHLNKKGVLILSGIIKKRLNDVISAFENAGFKIEKVINKGDWYALTAIYVL